MCLGALRATPKALLALSLPFTTVLLVAFGCGPLPTGYGRCPALARNAVVIGSAPAPARNACPWRCPAQTPLWHDPPACPSVWHPRGATASAAGAMPSSSWRFATAGDRKFSGSGPRNAAMACLAHALAKTAPTAAKLLASVGPGILSGRRFLECPKGPLADSTRAAPEANTARAKVSRKPARGSRDSGFARGSRARTDPAKLRFKPKAALERGGVQIQLAHCIGRPARLRQGRRQPRLKRGQAPSTAVASLQSLPLAATCHRSGSGQLH